MAEPIADVEVPEVVHPARPEALEQTGRRSSIFPNTHPGRLYPARERPPGSLGQNAAGPIQESGAEYRHIHMGNLMIRRLQNESGATMAEYALMVSFVAIAALVAVQAFGGSVLGLFQSAVDLMP